jgi:hypothetical protein
MRNHFEYELTREPSPVKEVTLRLHSMDFKLIYWAMTQKHPDCIDNPSTLTGMLHKIFKEIENG